METSCELEDKGTRYFCLRTVTVIVEYIKQAARRSPPQEGGVFASSTGAVLLHIEAAAALFRTPLIPRGKPRGMHGDQSMTLKNECKKTYKQQECGYTA